MLPSLGTLPNIASLYVSAPQTIFTSAMWKLPSSYRSRDNLWLRSSVGVLLASQPVQVGTLTWATVLMVTFAHLFDCIC